MAYSESNEKNHQNFFANTTDCGIQASFSNAQGRKNYLIPTAQQFSEEAPMAVESFSMPPDQYHALMERINKLYD